jgi:DNA repair protein RadC
MKTATKTTMNSRNLKNHFRYLVPQIRLALIKEPGVEPQLLTGPADLEKFVEPLKTYSEEHFVSFHLDGKNAVIGYQIVSHGTLTASLVHPREVFKAALIGNSNSIIVAHNHPAGTLVPSKEDIETTKQLIEAGNILGVRVLDHIIVSSNGIKSLREHLPELWRS